MAAFMTGAASNDKGFAIAVQDPGDLSTLTTFVDGPGQDVFPAIHPDGNWIAYASGDFLAMDTYVRPFPSGEGRWKVSIGNGGLPFWSPDGRRLYYTQQGQTGSVVRLMEVDFDGSGAQPELGRPVELFSTDDVIGERIGVDADGRFFYVVNEEVPEGEDQPDTNGIVLVENWLTRFVD